LRPHVKTHKLPEVIAMQVAAGIKQFKTATIAETEMTAEAGGTDILFAYPPVGPNIGRVMELTKRYPAVQFSALADDPNMVEAISRLFHPEGKTLRLFVDIDCGMHRTGIEMGEAAIALCRQIDDAPGTEFAGLHVYDGHIHDIPLEARKSRFTSDVLPVEDFVRRLNAAGTRVKTIVGGGSPTFGLHAGEADEGDRLEVTYQCSPGTWIFWDENYSNWFPELGFIPAAMLLIRVISRPSHDLLCLDLGHKAVAAEMPIEGRVGLQELPDAEPIQQNEEHLVVRTPRAKTFAVGDVIYGSPRHICPTVALHQEAVIIRGGRATGERWAVKARDRRLTV